MKPKSQIIKRMDGIDLSGSSKNVNAVVVENSDVSKFIGSFTETEATDKYRAGYCGKNNQIVAQGMVLFKWNGTAPNGAVIKRMSTTDLTQFPDIPFYTEIDMQPYSVYAEGSSDEYPVYEVRGAFIDAGEYIGRYNGKPCFNNELRLKAYEKTTGQAVPFYKTKWGFPTSTDGFTGFSYAWREIFPPGSEYKVTTNSSEVFKYGYALSYLIYKYVDGDGRYYLDNAYSFPVPFASMDEYNAAVCLTYEPQ